jgi:hypothetical protein
MRPVRLKRQGHTKQAGQLSKDKLPYSLNVG